jgi:hypothetical protein
MLNKEMTLLNNRNVPSNSDCGNAIIQIQCAQFITDAHNACINGVSQLPIHPGFEKHPYKGVLQNVDAEKYIIGTFPPISYLIDILQSMGTNISKLTQPTIPHQEITKPIIPFFHGNMGSLWSMFLTPQELGALNALLPADRVGAKNYLIETLNRIGIYYDDIIKSTQRKLGKVDQRIKNLGYTYEDKNLRNICLDEELIIQLITNQNTRVVCFTNGATFGVNGLQIYEQLNRAGLVKTTNSDALSLFLRGCQDLGLRIELQCLPHYTWTPLIALNQAQLSKKLIFEIRVIKGDSCNHRLLIDFKQKSFTAITPFSPAATRFMGNHPIVTNFLANNGNPPLASMLVYVYDKFRNNQHALLYPYNI